MQESNITELLSDIPDWLLKQNLVGMGERQPKRPIPVVIRPWQQFPRHRCLPSTAWKRPDGNLNYADYRYWTGRRESVFQMRNCRFCNKVCFNDIEKKEHKEAGRDADGVTCGKKTDIICGYLAKDPMCVICDRQTSDRSWGIPICDGVCVEEWMFVTNRVFNAWEAAKKLAEKNGWQVK